MNARPENHHECRPVRLFEGLDDPSRLAIETADGQNISYERSHGPHRTTAICWCPEASSPGDRVQTQTEKSVAGLVLYLATIRAGAVYLPLNTAYTPTEIDYFLNDAKPRIFVCDPAKRMGWPPPPGRGRAPRDARRPRRGRRQPQRAGRNGSRASSPAGRAPAERPRRDPLHLGDDRPLQGRHAHPGQSPVQRRSRCATTGASPPTTCCCTLPIFPHPRPVRRVQHCDDRRWHDDLPAEIRSRLVVKLLAHATVMMGVPTFYTRYLRARR